MQTQKNLPILLCLLFALVPLITFGQRAECGTVLPEGYEFNRDINPERYEKYVRDFKADFNNRSSSGSCINYAPIKAHIVRQSDGTGGLTVAELDAAITTMNLRYEAACLAFYICGDINYIDNDTYYDFDDSDEAAMTSANNVDNLINVYFCNSVGSGSSAYCGYAYFPGGPDVVLMANSCTINGSTLSHELGHFFALPHTHSGGTELVNGSNCTTAGDRFCDTEADPQLGSGNVNSSCIYTGTETDANGDLYVPNPRNIMSYSRKACRDFFSVEQYAEMSYTFLNVRNYWDCPDFDVDFSVDADQSCTAPFMVSFTEEAVGETTYAWDFENDGTVDATDPNPTFTYTASGTYDVCLSISDGTTTISKIKTAYINVGSEAFPYNKDMENFSPATNATGYQDGWTASPSGTTSIFRWNVDSGGTPSDNTGPDIDNTTGTGSGIYIHTEATGGSTGDIAELISPCLEIPAAENSSDPSIGFWYHMYGSNMGTLHIDLHNGTTWVNDFAPAIVGQQHTSETDPYTEQTFSVAAYKGQSIQIRFRGERGSGFRSDMAIDDFRVFDNTSLPVELLTFEGKADRGQHQLIWQTATEDNSAYFAVEHGTDGINFETIGQVKAKGFSAEINDYFHLNKNPKEGENYYRLKMVDLDEKFEYSQVISLTHESVNDGLSIFPNPSRGQYQLSMSAENEVLDFVVYNAIGQSVKTGQWLPNEGNLNLDLSTFANGIYTIRVQNKSILVALENLVKY